jgi:hypothetical protein
VKIPNRFSFWSEHQQQVPRPGLMSRRARGCPAAARRAIRRAPYCTRVNTRGHSEYDAATHFSWLPNEHPRVQGIQAEFWQPHTIGMKHEDVSAMCCAVPALGLSQLLHCGQVVVLLPWTDTRMLTASNYSEHSCPSPPHCRPTGLQGMESGTEQLRHVQRHRSSFWWSIGL